MKKNEIVRKKSVRLVSRPDLGIVTILDILRFGELVCIRSSKGGIFDEFDLLEVSPDDEKKFKVFGGDSAHSKRDWVKNGIIRKEEGKGVAIADIEDIQELKVKQLAEDREIKTI